MSHERIVWVLCGAMVLCGVGCAGPQVVGDRGSAEEVVARYFEARGGEEALRGLSVVERLGTMQVLLGAGNETGTYHTCVAYPDRGVVAVDAGVAKVFEVINSSGAWECEEGFTACKEAHPRKAEELTRTALEANRELLYEVERWTGATLEESGGRFVIDARIVDVEVRYTFSKDTGLLEEKRKGRRSRRYGDWRMVDGVAFPFEIEDYDGDLLMLRIRLVEVVSSKGLEGWCAEKLKEMQ